MRPFSKEENSFGEIIKDYETGIVRWFAVGFIGVVGEAVTFYVTSYSLEVSIWKIFFVSLFSLFILGSIFSMPQLAIKRRRYISTRPDHIRVLTHEGKVLEKLPL